METEDRDFQDAASEETSAAPAATSFLDSLREKVRTNREGKGFRVAIPGSGGMLIGVYKPKSWDIHKKSLPRLGQNLTVESSVSLLAGALSEIIGVDGDREIWEGEGVTWKELAQKIGSPGFDEDGGTAAQAIMAIFPNEPAIVTHALVVLTRITQGEQDATEEALGE